MILLDLIETLIYQNSPFGYVSGNVKKVIKDILSVENDKSFAYYYIVEDYYQTLMLYVCLKAVYENLAHSNKIKLADISLGDSLIYGGEYFTFGGEAPDFKGKYILLGVGARKKGKNSPVSRILDEEAIVNGVTIATTVKRGSRVKDTRKKLADYLGISDFSRTNSQKIIIIAELNLLKKIEQVRLMIKNETLFFGELCPAWYFPNKGEKKRIAHDLSNNDPIVYFFSNISESLEYIENEKLPSHIYIFGDKFEKGFKRSDFNSIIDIHNENDIQLGIFGTVPTLFESDLIEDLSLVLKKYIWTDSYMTANREDELKVSYNFIPVSNNDDFQINVEKLHEFLAEMRNDSSKRYLHNLLIGFLRTVLGQTHGGESAVFAEKMNVISEYSEKIGFHETKRLRQMLSDLSINRFGFNVSQKIKQITHSKHKIALVVYPDLLNDTIEYYAINNINIVVLPSNAKLTEDMIYQYDHVILVNLKPADRRKWVSANVAKDYYFMFPKMHSDWLAKSLKRDERILQQVNKINELSGCMEGSYYQCVQKYLQSEELIQDINGNELLDEGAEDLLEEMEDKIESEMEVISRIVEKNSNESEYLIDKDADKNAFVTINKKILLESGDVILGTDFGRAFVLVNGITYRKDISSINVCDEIVEFVVPYSNEIYLKRFQNDGYLFKSYSDFNEKEKAEFLDYYWKTSLEHYRKQNMLSSEDLADLFYRAGDGERKAAFLNQWTNSSKFPLLPRDKEFIKFVGKVIGDKNIEENYMSFYRASEKVKNNLRELRDQTIEEFDGMPLEQILDNTEIEFSQRLRVIGLLDINYPDVPRQFTNRIIRGES